ncbi:hypothetical protein [Alcanivorax sp. 1008]|uniref:hypothetical protein n=1 Tax=Alcanivorax sp. 1008 TaxID=2816853 RepID=UPI001D3E7591|nr:hypothetical protein [Alcanivorax sp. 1008]MCC1495881.1 hypothetical protein [Alcanivorax sp. 1008]
MSPERFVAEFKELREYIRNGYFSPDSEISRLQLMRESGFSEAQIGVANKIVSEALTDALYTVLLGIDGCSAIGSHQEAYRLAGENGERLSGFLETLAWDLFHGKST